MSEACLERLAMTDEDRGESTAYRPFPLVMLVHDLPYFQNCLLLKSVSQRSEVERRTNTSLPRYSLNAGSGAGVFLKTYLWASALEYISSDT